MSGTRAALLLVDLQHDFLASPGLEPAAGALVERAGALLAGWRRRGAPVVHVVTTVRRDDDRRMPHWRAAGTWRCEAGTPGHATPVALRPRDGEPVLEKTDFDAFHGTELEAVLERLGIGAVVLAGTHLHACIRTTALSAYARRLEVVLAQDAIGTDDPLHAAAARAWLEPRGIAFATVGALLGERRPGGPGSLAGVRPGGETRGAATGASAPVLPTLVGPAGEETAGASARRLVHEAPARTGTALWSVAAADPPTVAHAVEVTARARTAATGADTVAALGRLATGVEREADALVAAIVADVGKPVTQAREEVERTLGLLRAVALRGDDTRTEPCGPASVAEDRPLGTIALLTPWNNPLAIPVGRIAPALVYGNGVVWKPAPAGTRIAVLVARLAVEAGLTALTLVAGDAATGAALMAHPAIDAVMLTGGAGAGWAAQAACARRGIPLQAELGGNNPALVGGGADVDAAARAVADGAFAFAGQRCTANRRVIVDAAVLDAFTAALRSATARLAFGRPESADVVAGPVVDVAARDRIEAAVARARDDGALLVSDPAVPALDALRAEGAYTPPVVLRCDDPAAEIVQEETFGPVLVVQPAQDWTQAIALANGVRHGLVASAFTDAEHERAQFLRDIRAGIVKLGTSTAGADVEAPFGGWKHSGVGPPEHGAANRALYTRPRAVYDHRP